MFIIVLPQYTNIRSLIGTCALIATLSYYAQNTSIRWWVCDGHTRTHNFTYMIPQCSEYQIFVR